MLKKKLTTKQTNKVNFDDPCSHDLVKVFVGRRLVRRLTGGGGEEDNRYFKDDDGDDDNDDDDDECDDDDDGDDRYGKGKYDGYMYAAEENREARVVSIHGTGELITIVFKSDPWVTRRGFFAHYTVGQGECFY